MKREEVDAVLVQLAQVAGALVDASVVVDSEDYASGIRELTAERDAERDRADAAEARADKAERDNFRRFTEIVAERDALRRRHLAALRAERDRLAAFVTEAAQRPCDYTVNCALAGRTPCLPCRARDALAGEETKP